MIHVTLLSHMKNIIKVNYSVLLPVNPNEYNREEMLEKITFFKNKIIDCHEVDGTYQALIGNFYYQIGDYKNAKKYSQEAFETTLDKSNACWTLMQIAVDEEDYESAYEYSKTVLNAKSFRVSAPLYYLASITLFSLGNYEEALEKISSAEYDLRYYDKLTIDSPSDNIYKHSGISVARCYVLKGIIEYCMDRTDASIETRILNQSHKHFPPHLLFFMMNILMRLLPDQILIYRKRRSCIIDLYFVLIIMMGRRSFSGNGHGIHSFLASFSFFIENYTELPLYPSV